MDADGIDIDPRHALTMRQVADRLGCSRRNATRLAQQWPHLRMGRRILVAPQTLQDYLRTCVRTGQSDR